MARCLQDCSAERQGGEGDCIWRFELGKEFSVSKNDIVEQTGLAVHHHALIIFGTTLSQKEFNVLLT
ncbi:MAG: hypothetical protein U5K54_21580 [Cytophagales bacterium]|nr:hypothetical protein [Cytophagales bacterium]